MQRCTNPREQWVGEALASLLGATEVAPTPLTMAKGYEIKRLSEQEGMIALQKKIYQSMTPDQKLKLALRLYYSAKQLKAAALHYDYPKWTEKEIQEEVREIFLYGRT